MADADRNNLKTDQMKEARNERNTAAQQPGATGKPAREQSPEEARKQAEGTYGKTEKHDG